MLQNAYFLAKIGVDAADNELKFADNLPRIGNYPAGSIRRAARRRLGRLGMAACWLLQRGAGPGLALPLLSRQRRQLLKHFIDEEILMRPPGTEGRHAAQAAQATQCSAALAAQVPFSLLYSNSRAHPPREILLTTIAR